MSIRINFINPFGTPVYNALIEETLTPYLRQGSELVVTHTEDCPENIDYFYNKHLMETSLFDAVLAGKAPSAEQRPSLGCNIKWIAGNEPEYFG